MERPVSFSAEDIRDEKVRASLVGIDRPFLFVSPQPIRYLIYARSLITSTLILHPHFCFR